MGIFRERFPAVKVEMLEMANDEQVQALRDRNLDVKEARRSNVPASRAPARRPYRRCGLTQGRAVGACAGISGRREGSEHDA